ncbi:hypothetical protein SAMN05421755_100440 [Nitrosomonas sp. Nm33]|nr:hypothetical protein SAMN05421755_100440 [Nitrosomonas sp. Nm33]
MSERGLCLAFQFRDDALSQHLAQLHAPLVEGIDSQMAPSQIAPWVKTEFLCSERRTQAKRGI